MSAIELAGQEQQSPFDAIRGYRANGSEYWTGRELMRWLGYTRWENFRPWIEQAIENLELAGEDVTKHLQRTMKLVQRSQGGGNEIEDFELSRLGCYHVALACSGKGKPMVAMAKQYFAKKTREAEVVVPALSERIHSLELELAIQTKINDRMERQDLRIGLHGLATTLLLEGKSDAIVEIDRPTLEVIDERSNSKYEGQTLTQIVEHLNKTRGIKIKSGKELARILEKKKLGYLMAQTPRSVLTEYVPTENLQTVYDAIGSLNVQQLLLG
jgi:hypothetical protein